MAGTIDVGTITIGGLDEAKRKLNELAEAFEKVKDDPIESDKLAKEFNTLQKAITATEKSMEELTKDNRLVSATFEDIYGDIQPLSGRIGELEDRLYELALAGKQSSSEFKNIQGEVAKMKKVIIDVDRSVDALAENQGIAGISTQFTDLGDKLLTLDFDGAAKSAKSLQQSIANISPGQIATQFKNLISVVGSLTKAFIQFGLSLLANPIFLIVAAVVAITAAIILLMNKLGILKPIIKAIGDAFKIVMDIINAVKQAFMDLTDWLGLTANAAEASAEKQIKASEKASKAAAENTEKLIDGMDHEIAKRKALGQDTAILEAQKQKEIIKSGKLEAERMAIRIKEHSYLKDISAEELQKLKDSLKDQTKAVKDAEQDLEVMRIQNAEKVKANAEKVRKNEQEVNKQRAADRKQFEQDRLSALRLSQDLELELMDAGLQKDLKANQYKYQRLIQDLKFNEKLTKDERLKLKEEYELLIGTKGEEIRKTYSDKEIAAEKAKQEILKANAKAFADEQTQFANEMQNLQFNRRALEIAAMEEGFGKEQALLELNQQKEIAAVNKNAQDKILANEQNLVRLEEQKQKELAIANLTATEKQAIEDSYKIKKDELTLQNNQLEKELTEQQKIELQNIEDKYAKIRADKEESERQAKIEAVNKTTSMMADATKTGLQGISDIVGAFAGKSVSAQKKAFETQKKINIVMATIDMIKGAVSAFSNAQQLGPIAGPIVGALVAASVVASGIANIKKISATKFEGGSTTPTSPSTNAGGGASTGGGAQPSFNLFGAPNQANTMTAQKSVESQPQTIQAVVVESEITASQNKVKKMQESATL